VHLRVLQFLLVGRLEFSETVIGHQTERLLLGLAVKDTQGSWETTRSEAVKVVLLSTFNFEVGFQLVSLGDSLPIFIPVVYTKRKKQNCKKWVVERKGVRC